MKIIKKTQILVETKREIIIRQSPSDTSPACQQCGVQMMTAQTISALKSIGIHEIYRSIEKVYVCFVETCPDKTHVCLNSISQIQK